VRYLWTGVLAALVPSLAGATAAETTREAVEHLGLVGTWGLNCAAPASTANPWAVFWVDNSGVVREQLNVGPSYPAKKSVIDSAAPITAATIGLKLRYDDPNWGVVNGVVFTTVVAKDGSGIRTMESESSNGHVYIKDGVYTAVNQPSPTSHRCEP
jgi:hypothetical protein